MKVGNKIKVLKGCTARGINKGITCVITQIVEMGADFSHCVKVQFQALNGSKAGTTFGFYARHINRLQGDTVRLNDGNSANTIEVRTEV